jgi:hypothetical protein
MRRETRQKLKAQALRLEMTMQAYLDWLLDKEAMAIQEGQALPFQSERDGLP